MQLKYRDLIQFEPIETIVQIKEASDKDKALQLIDTYVISDRMADELNYKIIEQLQFLRPADNKGLLVVGNYGTGKSHLMSVISTVAELEGSASRLNHPDVAEKAKEIEGKFKVLRTELDGIRMSLQEFVFGELTDYLQSINVDYEHPDLERLRSNKDELIRMMSQFEQVYPNHGLLLVIDELLDYLRSRNEQELILDLNFLRAMGEICRNSRFRFIAGVQEMLFDNPTFSFVAQQLNRVKERMEQALIVREDIEYVVSRRLLRKDERQKALIREHLQQFTPLYGRMSEQLEKFVELFPVHPAYLSVFERISVAEKRVILKTLSIEMKKLLDQEVPKDQPGLISYDQYWTYIEEDRGLRADPNIREVLSVASVLFDRIENAFSRPQYRPLANRIVRGLAVFRLTTDNIHAPVGITAEELRDHLLLYADLPEKDAEFLRGHIEVVLKEILKTVSYQYISLNRENGQYYIDLEKVTDVDSLIEEKAKTLSSNQLDTHYFNVLGALTGHTAETQYRSGYRIWQHELPWTDRMVTRPGYLFFGNPNERSTTQPERDFYIYMLPVFDKKSFKNEDKPDEVFFTLDTKDETFYQLMRYYAGAKEMAASSSISDRHHFERKAAELMKELTNWLVTNVATAYKLTYKGETRRLAEWNYTTPPHPSFLDHINAAANICLSNWFNDKYPDYPTFRNIREPITSESMLTTYIPEALHNIKDPKTKNGITILSGLVLLDEKQRLNVRQSGYARWVLETLNNKPDGQVVNANELLKVVEVYNRHEEVKRTVRFDLEPELFAVVLAALVYSGDIVLTINRTEYDGMNFDELLKLSAAQIAEFTHLKKPSGIPLAAIGECFDLFQISRSLLNVTDRKSMEFAVRQLNIEARKLLEQVVQLDHAVRDGIPLHDTMLLDGEELRHYREQIDKIRRFLNDLLIYDTPAKLNNFKFDVQQVSEQRQYLESYEKLNRLQIRASELSQELSYLSNAQNNLPSNHEWSLKVDALIGELIHALKNHEEVQAQRQTLRQLKDEYALLYLKLHDKARLNATQDAKKSALLADTRVDALRKLFSLELLPVQEFDQWQQKINSLRTCWNLTREKLKKSSICKDCNYRPKDEVLTKLWDLNELEAEVDRMLEKWTSTLLVTLNDAEIKDQIELLRPDQRALVTEFMEKQSFMLPIDLKFIDAIRTLLQGIRKVHVTLSDFETMMNYGQPMTVDEVKQRFEQLLREKVGPQPASNVRIILHGEETAQ